MSSSSPSIQQRYGHEGHSQSYPHLKESIKTRQPRTYTRRSTIDDKRKTKAITRSPREIFHSTSSSSERKRKGARGPRQGSSFFSFFFLACEPQNLIQYVWFDTLSYLLCFWGSFQSTQNYGTRRYLRQQTKPTLGFGTNMDEKIFESEVLH